MTIFQKFILKVFFLALPLFFVSFYNFALDPFCVLRKNIESQVTEPNQHFLKIDYLLKNPNRYNSYIFGSSRATNIDVRKIKGGSYYNMYYPEGLPDEWFSDIKFMVNKGVDVKKVLIALDDFSFQYDPKSHERNHLFRPYPKTVGDKINFYLFYLFQRPDFGLLKHINQQKKKKNRIVFDLYNSGMALKEFRDRAIEAEPEAHMKQAVFSKKRDLRNYATLQRLNQVMKTLGRLKIYCSDHNIELIVMLNPLNSALYGDHYNVLRVRLAEMLDYWDFSGPNTVTKNNYFYYEDVHYRPVVGDMIISKIFKQDLIDVPDDFGVFITKSNVHKYIMQSKMSPS